MAEAIRHRVLTLAGETHEGGDASKCPGESRCDDWAQPFEGTYEQKVESICFGCPKFATKPAGGEPADAAIDDEEIESYVDEVEGIVFLENGGEATDWAEYPFEIYQLACWWRAAEREVAEMRAMRLDALVKAFSK